MQTSMGGEEGKDDSGDPGAPGASESYANESELSSMDINDWLKQNRLNRFKDYFEENELILSDLLKYTDQDMELNLILISVTHSIIDISSICSIIIIYIHIQ